uniref:MI domain-containing protein n=1 Tax=Angiostrongylus cantonensis TaxID=6313 RepID=A0A0K0D5L3_ANGCA
MPFPTKCKDEDDPEEIAERELAKMNEALGITDSRRTARSSVQAAPQPCPEKPATKHIKEAKALRKMRNRGVSGSSIKKDGGRFDYGLDYDGDYDDPEEDVEEDEYAEYELYKRDSYSSHSMGIGSLESDTERSIDSLNRKRRGSEQAARVYDCLVAALSSDDDGIRDISAADLLVEEKDETRRVQIIYDAVYSICSLEETEEIVADPLYELRLVLMVSRLIYQGLLKSSSISYYLENALEMNHSIRLLNAANNVREDTVDKSEQMRVVEKLAKQLTEEFDTEAVAGYLLWFEVNDPVRTSMAALLTKYAVADFHIIDKFVFHRCPTPRRFLKADPAGIVSVVEKGGEH